MYTILLSIIIHDDEIIIYTGIQDVVPTTIVIFNFTFHVFNFFLKCLHIIFVSIFCTLHGFITVKSKHFSYPICINYMN